MHLPTALELVHEMRQRNVSPNTHTYSSMLNVCVKAGELDLALDVFSQVRRLWWPLALSCRATLLWVPTTVLRVPNVRWLGHGLVASILGCLFAELCWQATQT
jgi:pentatricopeptide repeat protein